MDTSKVVESQATTGDVARRMKIARSLSTVSRDMDEGMPEWMRRSNPIIRRQLGIHWRVFLPQIGPIVKWVGLQAIIILLTIPFPDLFSPLMLLALSTAFMLPFGFWLYVQTLNNIANDAVKSMSQEFESKTFDLLRVTPQPLFSIVLAKAMAAIWRRMDDLDAVISIALFTSLPVITFFNVIKWPPDVYPGVSQGLIVVGLVVSLLRLPLEMFMVSAIGIMNGTSVRWQSPATTATLVVTFFYFLLLNLPRLIALPLSLQILVEIVLPLSLPLIIGSACLMIAIRIINSD